RCTVLLLSPTPAAISARLRLACAESRRWASTKRPRSSDWALYSRAKVTFDNAKRCSGSRNALPSYTGGAPGEIEATLCAPSPRRPACGDGERADEGLARLRSRGVGPRPGGRPRTGAGEPAAGRDLLRRLPALVLFGRGGRGAFLGVAGVRLAPAADRARRR